MFVLIVFNDFQLEFRHEFIISYVWYFTFEFQCYFVIFLAMFDKLVRVLSNKDVYFFVIFFWYSFSQLLFCVFRFYETYWDDDKRVYWFFSLCLMKYLWFYISLFQIIYDVVHDSFLRVTQLWIIHLVSYSFNFFYRCWLRRRIDDDFLITS
jgi:hypothetical protein